jgi:hypothetical protein
LVHKAVIRRRRWDRGSVRGLGINMQREDWGKDKIRLGSQRVSSAIHCH